jgi:hypothetical protein
MQPRRVYQSIKKGRSICHTRSKGEGFVIQLSKVVVILFLGGIKITDTS